MQLNWIPLIAIVPFIFSCAQPGASLWKPYSFNSSEFQPATQGSVPALWLRSGYMPRLDEPPRHAQDTGRLPTGTGSVAGICYMQASGGKKTDNPTVTAYPDEQIIIKSSQEGISVTRTDDAGYFIEILFPGEYEILCRGTGKPVTVKKGETTLVPLRGGKRMVD